MDRDVLLTDFLTWHGVSKGRTSQTIYKYRSILNRLFCFLSEKHKVSSPVNATFEMLEEFTGLHAHEQGISPSARKPMVSAVRVFYGWLVRTKHLATSTAAELQYPKSGRPLPTVARLETIQTLLMAPDLKTLAGVRDTAIMAILFDVGPRRSGLVNLNESDLIFQRDNKGEHLVIKLREKGKKERTVPVTTETRLLVRAYLAFPNLKAIDRTLEDGDRVLFVSLMNNKVPPDQYHGEARRLSPKSINDIILRHGIPARLPASELHPHAFRHLVGTEIYESTNDLYAVATILGHSRIETAKMYTHLAMRRKTEVMGQASPIKRIITPATELAKQLEKANPPLSGLD